MHEVVWKLMVISHCDNVNTRCDKSRKVIILNRNE
jgi:hypothetical protein